ncbi:MAG: hypothetical protein WBE75_00810 [Candidatus Omnitrophota bacterium]
MEEKDRRMMRDYAWNYFSMHADQRLKTFNFYVAISTLLIGTFVAFTKEAPFSRWVCILPFLLTVLSFVFWKFEIRNRQLIRNGEAALQYLDEQLELEKSGEAPHLLKIIARDAYFSGQSQDTPFKKAWTYSTCFNAVFMIFGFGGVVLGLVCLLLK